MISTNDTMLIKILAALKW